MRIFHIAAAEDWADAQRTGTYAYSTLGTPLVAGEYIHAAYRHQLRTVRNRFFAEVYTPLMLLEIDTDRLDSPVVHEQPAPGAEEIYPHIYGPLNLDAVVGVRDITRTTEPEADRSAPATTVDA
jgi:uncharacterized protein (DUF952 family)